MTVEKRVRLLGYALYAVGSIFIVGVPLLMGWLWHDGFGWDPAQSEYEQMIMGVYVTLGVFLVRAARNPMQHASLIWFTVWSSVVHGTIMLVQALVDGSERTNLMGDIPSLFVVAAVLAVLTPRGADAATLRSAEPVGAP